MCPHGCYRNLCWTLHSFGQSMRVVDGDTVASRNTTYRLFGNDAPEAGQKCMSRGSGTWPCGQQATAAMVSLVAGKDVTCDDRGLDEYGRTQAVCFVAGPDINAAMIDAGLAWSFRKYAHVYDALEDRARARRVGVWQAATQTPWDYRAERWEGRRADGAERVRHQDHAFGPERMAGDLWSVAPRRA